MPKVDNIRGLEERRTEDSDRPRRFYCPMEYQTLGEIAGEMVWEMVWEKTSNKKPD